MKSSHLDDFSDRKLKVILALATLIAGWFCYSAAGQTPSAPTDLSPATQQVINLSKAHLNDDVILAYIRNSGASYHLTADDILYLNSQGVSQAVISAMMQAQGAPTAPAPTPSAPQPSTPPPSAPPQVLPPGGAPPAQPGVAAPSTPPPAVGPQTPPPGSEISLSYFQTQLAPYGQWVTVPGYGQVWSPFVQSQVPGWRPYLNGGHWEYTEDGWYWASDYPWGEYVFHYGRWTRVDPYGWVWVPGYHWGPAWVCWRDADAAGYSGWAPLPPGAHFEPGVGLVWNGQVADNVDFGLAPDMFVFVPYDHFWAHDYLPWVAPRFRVPGLFRASLVLNGYHFVGGHFFIGGFHDRIVLRTHFDAPLFHIGFHDHLIEHDRAWGFDHAHDFHGHDFHDHGHDFHDRDHHW